MTTKPRENFPPKRYIFCNTCKNETNHSCEADCYRDYQNIVATDVTLDDTVGYRLWICAGCEEGTLERYYVCEPLDEADSELFPARTRLHVAEKQFKQLPKKLDAIYREILKAYNNNLLVLSAIGIRALLEGICADKGIESSGLQGMIERMASILPSNIVSNLHGIRFIGNVAAHQLTAPELGDLRLAIDICEDLLNFLYELDYKASLLNRAQNAKKSKAKA